MGAVNGVLVGRLRLPSIIVTLGDARRVARRAALGRPTARGCRTCPRAFSGSASAPTRGAGGSSSSSRSACWRLAQLGAAPPRGRARGLRRRLRRRGRAARRHRAAARDRSACSRSWARSSGSRRLLNAVRFTSVPSNAGVGLELKAVAAVVVGGTAITGGRGTLLGTLLGVALLGTIGTALTFVGINPFWEKAIQGGIILAALASDAARSAGTGRASASCSPSVGRRLASRAGASR